MPGDGPGPAPDPDAPDLGAVGDLCRLLHVARRLGCDVRLTRVSPALGELLELAGVDALFDGTEGGPRDAT
ncbi:MAG TPA: hypothetical protein VK866_13020 [Acidimicrobiales bacterium]|nr:hypothetical protein [Acidimicrobiales bacterium]